MRSSSGHAVPGNLVKNAGAISWSEVDSREAALIERCAAGDDPARDRRAALRGDCVLAGYRCRHREITVDPRPSGAARGAAGAARMTPYLTCEAAAELLEAFVDGELAMAAQVAVESHLR